MVLRVERPVQRFDKGREILFERIRVLTRPRAAHGEGWNSSALVLFSRDDPKQEAIMYDRDMLFASFPDTEMIPVMKRAFDETSAAVHAWGACGTVFEEDEAEEREAVQS